MQPLTQPASHHRSAQLGKCQLIAAVGTGGMAEVFLAVAQGPMGFNKLAVVKRLRAGMADEPTVVEMFLDEAKLAARLKHPNVVHTYDIGEEDGSYFIAMEYLAGQPLRRVAEKQVQAEGAPLLTPALWVRIVADALDGLHHAHELKDYDGTSLQIVHRDISPHNIFVTYDAQRDRDEVART
jgi:serine/threonine protein kinase